ncbi:MAG: hypothetical protein H7Y00_16380 [Fimbriimonadaceae bacterium]|nr:hypothetical protein [Chitinophagales bacterium]
MTKTITQDNLIRYIYNEISLEEASLIDEAIKADWALKELYEQLLEGKTQLDKAAFSPKKIVIDTILAYSKDTAPMEHTL